MNNTAIAAARDPSGLLTWADVVKVWLPVGISVLMVWGRHKYLTWRERKDKQKALWTGLSAPALNLHKAIAQLEDLAVEYQCDRVRVIQFDVPETLTNFSNRLAELDPKNALIYCDYVSFASITRSGFEFLNGFVRSRICESDCDTELLKMAIRAQVNALKKDLITLAEREFEVLRHLASTDRRFNRDTIRVVKNIIEEVKNKEGELTCHIST